jgi:hypothetical protein
MKSVVAFGALRPAQYRSVPAPPTGMLHTWPQAEQRTFMVSSGLVRSVVLDERQAVQASNWRSKTQFTERPPSLEHLGNGSSPASGSVVPQDSHLYTAETGQRSPVRMIKDRSMKAEMCATRPHVLEHLGVAIYGRAPDVFIQKRTPKLARIVRANMR